MILLCGIPSEPPLKRVREALDESALPYILFNQRNFAKTSLAYDFAGGRINGSLVVENEIFDLRDFSGVYVRLMDDQALPETVNADSRVRARARRLHEVLFQWLEIAAARVVNRASAMGSNTSKPYQAQLIAKHGFSVPETLITNDPALVRDFQTRHKRLIYKSISSVRSIVQPLEPGDWERLEQIRWCPTQFQEFIEGSNIRVHIVGEQVFATAVETEATDYRYAHDQGSYANLSAVELPDDLAASCVRLSRALGLAFAGIDLNITPRGEVFCFEVNPSPGFSYFEAQTGQPIAKAVANYLAGK